MVETPPIFYIYQGSLSEGGEKMTMVPKLCVSTIAQSTNCPSVVLKITQSATLLPANEGNCDGGCASGVPALH